jgi:hypothetical protein
MKPQQTPALTFRWVALLVGLVLTSVVVVALWTHWCAAPSTAEGPPLDYKPRVPAEAGGYAVVVPSIPPWLLSRRWRS